MLMDQQHPITPPPELVQQWCRNWTHAHGEFGVYLATKAACWGFRQCIKVDVARLEDKLQKARDQELEACMEWMRSHFHGVPQWADQLRDARRPKPPSLAEQGQRILVENGATLDGRVELDPEDVSIINAALERLQELEKGNE